MAAEENKEAPASVNVASVPASMTDEGASSQVAQPRRPRAIDELGERMKQYEKAALTAETLDARQPMVARIDGHKFSSFTRGFQKPFDERIHACMRDTMVDLTEHFHAATGYTHSDEITLVFPACAEGQTPTYSGRVLKLAGVLAGFASVRFAQHMQRQRFDAEGAEKKLAAKVMDAFYYFDARVFNVPSAEEVYNNLLWRSHFDCRRNGVSGLARAHFSNREMHGKGTGALISMLADKGIRWEDMPAAYRSGLFAKKELYEKAAVNPRSGQEERCVRSRVATRSMELQGFTQEKVELLLSKTW